MLELPNLLLRFFDFIDKILVLLFPKVFALGKEIVIRKKNNLAYSKWIIVYNYSFKALM